MPETKEVKTVKAHFQIFLDEVYKLNISEEAKSKLGNLGLDLRLNSHKEGMLEGKAIWK